MRKFCSRWFKFNGILYSWLVGRFVYFLSEFLLVTALFAAAVNLEIRPVNFEDVFLSIAHGFK